MHRVVAQANGRSLICSTLGNSTTVVSLTETFSTNQAMDGYG